MAAQDLFVKINSLPEDIRKELEEYVDKLLKRLKKEPKAKRPIGLMKGKIWIADDFDEPLEDFKDYM
ncbi:MAG TPA: DUF2281 domain-containing protein [Flavobacteriales bacterium]|nr:DUF2281 domain-containing protein [Flavobacteriales bacterium]HRN36043.1 DUF2281 domain-containing protein [Flavobacteriales bacterium]HRO40948.1 DUF2281 domain-containing protein [Flavobacteriales bacterium]HRP81558.1 DUF2281 domain-containing protein [Flavobacteriales bacterium]HRQ84765.1 DUF2281 domain-containing protein [Flavobacteriales bacterium]